MNTSRLELFSVRRPQLLLYLMCRMIELRELLVFSLQPLLSSLVLRPVSFAVPPVASKPTNTSLLIC
jgi:hypothetical protein